MSEWPKKATPLCEHLTEEPALTAAATQPAGDEREAGK